ncbi:50S ribosomal protein L21e [archaeon]|nr:50S ribosomal protein L21e [archaeon]MBU2565287.1 50S ribosomal protein L21e [Candidatus Thermoplasmatota archaeon]
MVKASKGLRSRTRQMRKKPRERGLSPITRSLQLFNSGEKASIVIDSSLHKGQPHPRFHGLTGTIIKTQGNAYLLEIKDGDKTKTVIASPEHLRKCKSSSGDTRKV